MPEVGPDTSLTSPTVPRGDNSGQVVSSLLSICGTAATVGQYSNVNAAETAWRGANGKWNRIGWGGNGATGGRSLATGAADAFRVLGRSLVGVNVLLSGYQGVQAYRQGNNAAAAKSGLDLGMSLVGLAGPLGATASALYFTGDMIGWDKIWNTAQKTAPAHCNPFIVSPAQFVR